jgi:hypothetical protein
VLAYLGTLSASEESAVKKDFGQGGNAGQTQIRAIL